MTYSAPVMKAASGDVRNNSSAVMSAGCPSRGMANGSGE